MRGFQHEQSERWKFGIRSSDMCFWYPQSIRMKFDSTVKGGLPTVRDFFIDIKIARPPRDMDGLSCCLMMDHLLQVTYVDMDEA